jgi:hypothetical protein
VFSCRGSNPNIARRIELHPAKTKEGHRVSMGVMPRLLMAVLAVGAVDSGAVVVVTLDAGTIPAGVECGDTWTEAGVVLSFVPTTDEDCTVGACYFGIGGLFPNGVDLYPARLNADLSGLSGTVVSAEVDIADYCGVGCTRAFLYEGATTCDSDSSSTVSAPETLTLSAGAGVIDRLAVSSCEGGVDEIRITLVASPVEAMSWGRIRSLYR